MLGIKVKVLLRTFIIDDRWAPSTQSWPQVQKGSLGVKSKVLTTEYLNWSNYTRVSYSFIFLTFSLFRAKIERKEGALEVCPEIFCENVKEAEHLAATLALYHLCKGQVWQKINKWANNFMSHVMTKYGKCPKILYTKVANKTAYANNADLDQTATEGAVWSGSTLFAFSLSILRNSCIKSKI